MKVDQFEVMELNQFEVHEISGGNPWTFLRDYVIGKVLDEFIEGVKEQMDSPATWDPNDPSNKMMNR